MNMTIASILGLLFTVSEVALAISKRAGSGARGADRGSLIVLWVVIVASINFAFTAAYRFPELGFGALTMPVCYLGAFLLILGLALRWYAISYLGKFFTVNVALAADQRVIDTGPYRFVRHPSYSGALLAILGLGMCIANWMSLLATTVPIWLVFLWRIHVEERALAEGLGEPYRAYMRRTRRLAPGIY
jgi:protein-S-isoprenylcysteine O-methyltransferase